MRRRSPRPQARAKRTGNPKPGVAPPHGRVTLIHQANGLAKVSRRGLVTIGSPKLTTRELDPYLRGSVTGRGGPLGDAEPSLRLVQTSQADLGVRELGGSGRKERGFAERFELLARFAELTSPMIIISVDIIHERDGLSARTVVDQIAKLEEDRSALGDSGTCLVEATEQRVDDTDTEDGVLFEPTLTTDAGLLESAEMGHHGLLEGLNGS